MAPKLQLSVKLGTVAAHGNGWRVQLKVERQVTYGPQRTTQAEAQLDLDRTRLNASRGEMLTFLVSLAQQARGEATKSQDLEPSQPSGSSGVAQPVADAGKTSTSESGGRAVDSFGQRQGTQRTNSSDSSGVEQPAARSKSEEDAVGAALGAGGVEAAGEARAQARKRPAAALEEQDADKRRRSKSAALAIQAAAL